MKIMVWVINTCVPSGTDPVFPKVCGSEAEAEAYTDEMLRNEWATNGPEYPETGERLPYPGEWRAAQDAIVAHEDSIADDIDDKWGRWEITSHEVELGDLAVVCEGGMIQAVVGNGALIGQTITTIDYDTEGAQEDSLVEIDQGDGQVQDAAVDRIEIGKSGITFPGWGNPTAEDIEEAKAAITGEKSNG